MPLDPTDPTWERVAPALRWLEDEDRRAVSAQALEADLNVLANALNNPAVISAAELERLERDVLRHGRGIPEKIQRKFAARFRAASSARKLRFRIVAALAAAVILVSGSLAFYLVRSSFRSRDAEQAAAEINAFLQKGDIDQAEAFLANLEKADSSLLLDPALAEAQQALLPPPATRNRNERKTSRMRSKRPAAPPRETLSPKPWLPLACWHGSTLRNWPSTSWCKNAGIPARTARVKLESGFRPRLEAISLRGRANWEVPRSWQSRI